MVVSLLPALSPIGIANVLASTPDFTQLGVAGITDAILLAGLAIVWSKYQKALADKDATTAAVLPVIHQAQTSIEAAALAMDRITRLYEQRIERPRDRR